MGKEPILAQFTEPVAGENTRLAVLADLHLSVDGKGTWRVSHRTADRLEAAVRSLNERSDLDAVLFIGDLVQAGLPREYEAFDRVIGELDHPFFAIPGNHDLISRGSDDSLELAEFERRYTPGELPYHERIGGIDLLALNSNRSTRDSVADSFEGRLEPETFAWLEDKLETVERPLVAVHHALPGTRSLLMDTMDRLPTSGGSPDFENADELLATLAAGNAPLVLTGHLHVPGVVTMSGVREFTLPSLGPYPSAYTVLEIDGSGTTARLHPIADYDDRVEAFAHGIDHVRVQLSAAQLAGLPLVDESSQ